MMKLKVENLTFSYEGRKILDQVGFCVKDGEFVSLLGPSGSGKSTILKILTGVLAPQEGRVAADGKEIHAGDPGRESGICLYAPKRSSVSLEDSP